MEEPPAQVPRHTTSLTRLWRRHDLADTVTKFLPTPALAVLPNLSRSFEQDKFRMLLVAMRASGAAAACTGSLLSTLQTSGRDAGHHRTVWAGPGAPGWYMGRQIDRSQVTVTHMSIGDPEFDDTKNENYLKVERRGQYNRHRGIDFHNKRISRSCPSGQRRCVRRIRFAFAYEVAADAWEDSGMGMAFALRGPASNEGNSNILKFYSRFSTNGLRIMCASAGDPHTLLTVPKHHCEPGRDEDALKTVTIDASFDWNEQRAHVRATTWDGTNMGASGEWARPFDRLPLSRLKMLFFGPGTHFVGDVDVWYYDMPAPTAWPKNVCRLPFVPCRDDQLRFGVGACLNGEELPATGPYGVSPFLLGGAPLGVPPPDDSDDADY